MNNSSSSLNVFHFVLVSSTFQTWQAHHQGVREGALRGRCSGWADGCGHHFWGAKEVGKIPLEKGMATTPVFLPGEFHGHRSLAGYSPWGRKQLDMTEQHATTKEFTCSGCSWTGRGPWSCFSSAPMASPQRGPQSLFTEPHPTGWFCFLHSTASYISAYLLPISPWNGSTTSTALSWLLLCLLMSCRGSINM